MLPHYFVGTSVPVFRAIEFVFFFLSNILDVACLRCCCCQRLVHDTVDRTPKKND